MCSCGRACRAGTPSSMQKMCMEWDCIHPGRQGRGFTSATARTDWLGLNLAGRACKKTGRMEMEEDGRSNTHGSKDSSEEELPAGQVLDVFKGVVCFKCISLYWQLIHKGSISNTHQPLLWQVKCQSLYLCNRDKGVLILHKWNHSSH